MIDLHSHVLPGIDDGPETWEEAVGMCRVAAKDGTHTLVVTPHITPGVFPNRKDGIASAVHELRTRLAVERIDLEVVGSAEVWLDPDLLLDGDDIIPYLGGERRFVLLHFPPRVVIDQVCELLYTLATRGITPIVTHPERQRQLQEDPERLRSLIAAGALSQITAASLTGKFGKSPAAVSRRFLELGLVHAIASDAHSIDYRPPILSEGLVIAAQVLGEAHARALVTEAPRAILEGRLPELPDPVTLETPAKRGFLSRFFSSEDPS